MKHGRYHRDEDAQSIQRYRCKRCTCTFSSATFTPTYRQKRRRLNRVIRLDMASSTAQRRIAIKHGCTRKTVARKVEFLAQRARATTAKWLAKCPAVDHVQWDELITFEHTRLKPLSVAVMVCVKTRRILGYGVAQLPASGLIAARSRRKYGPRRDRSGIKRREILKSLAPHLSSTVLIESDEHQKYGTEIKTLLPEATHIQYPSVRGALTGQGELKRTGFDPLWGINHTLAMMRDNIKRLARRTWCTTKLAHSLDDVLAIYVDYHNTVLVTQTGTKKRKTNHINAID